MFKEFYQRLTSCFSKSYGIHTYYESKPEICFKTSLFGKAEMVVAGKNSRLEEISKEEVTEALEKLKAVRGNSEKRKSDRG